MNVSYTFESPYQKTLPAKYDEKIEILMKKLEKEYGKTKWENLKAKIKLAKEKFLDKIQAKYLAMDCEYILEKILE